MTYQPMRTGPQKSTDEVPPAMTPLLTVKQAAELLGVSGRTLWSMYTSGEIPVIRIRRTVRFSVADLKAWIARHRTAGRQR